MCTEIIHGSEVIGSIGELRALIGGEPVLNGPEPFPDYGDNCCLCVVNVAATLQRAGFIFEHDEGFDVYSVKASPGTDDAPGGERSSDSEGEAL